MIRMLLADNIEHDMLYDDDDADLVECLPLSIVNGYAYVTGGELKGVRLHQLLCPEAGECVHHINGDKLDNRKANLMALAGGEHLRLHAWMRKHQVPWPLRKRLPGRRIEPMHPATRLNEAIAICMAHGFTHRLLEEMQCLMRFRENELLSWVPERICNAKPEAA